MSAEGVDFSVKGTATRQALLFWTIYKRVMQTTWLVLLPITLSERLSPQAWAWVTWTLLISRWLLHGGAASTLLSGILEYFAVL